MSVSIFRGEQTHHCLKRGNFARRCNEIGAKEDRRILCRRVQLFMGENKPGFEKVFYLNEDGTIRIEYEEIPPEIPKPTQLDRIEAAINQSNTALSQTYSEIENRIIDNYTMSLVENNII